MPTLSLSVIEVIILMLGAITLGITIHFFITSRKSLRDVTSDAAGKVNKELEVWKLKYFNDTEDRDRELDKLRKRVQDAEENSNIYSIEAEELREANKRLKSELHSGHAGTPVVSGQELTELRRQLEEAEENVTIYSIEAEEQRASNKQLRAEIEALKKNKAATPAPAQPHRDTEQLRKRMEEAEAGSKANAREIEELRIVNQKLQTEIELLRHMQLQEPAVAASGKPDYMEQLRQAKSSLLEHNQQISQLLGQIDMVKETEEKQQALEKLNEELSIQVEELQYKLSQKDKEISNIRQKEHLTTEMNAMLDSAYSEFNVLQNKMQKLEQQVAASRKLSLDYEELNEAHQKISRDFEEQKGKYLAFAEENRQLKSSLNTTEDQLREAEFQRQQLHKRVMYLEELNSDMQVMVDANKKLESQLKRIGELESMLNVIAEERDQLMQRKSNL